MTRPLRLPLDPYPLFVLSSLDFDLDNLERLHPYQLALVHFSPLATAEQRLRADVLFWQKRREGIEESGEEIGLREVTAGLRQMNRAREWLEGKAPGSQKMRDMGVQTDPPPAPPPPRQEVSLPTTTATTATPAVIQLPSSSSPPPVPNNRVQTPAAAVPLGLSNASTSAPNTPSSSSQSNAPCPAELESQFFVLRCGDLSPRVSTVLFAHFLLRRNSKALLPFFFGIRRANTTTVDVAFRSYDDAYTAQTQLDGQTVPRMKCKIRASVKGRSRGTFKWRHLNPETRRSWIEDKKLPDKEFVDQAKPPGHGITVSQEYHNELRRIEAAGQPSAERMSEADCKLAEEARDATLKWRRENWGKDYDGHSDSCETCPAEYGLHDADRVGGVYKIVKDTQAQYPDLDGLVWRPILKSPVLRAFVRAYGFSSLGLRADQMPWYRPPPPLTAPPTPPPGLSPEPSRQPPPPAASQARPQPATPQSDPQARPLPAAPPPVPQARPLPAAASQARSQPAPIQPAAPHLPPRPTFKPIFSPDTYYNAGPIATTASSRPGPSAYPATSASLHNISAVAPSVTQASHARASQAYDLGGWAAQKRTAGEESADPRKRARYDPAPSFGRT